MELETPDDDVAILFKLCVATVSAGEGILLFEALVCAGLTGVTPGRISLLRLLVISV